MQFEMVLFEYNFVRWWYFDRVLFTTTVTHMQNQASSAWFVDKREKNYRVYELVLAIIVSVITWLLWMVEKLCGRSKSGRFISFRPNRWAAIMT